MRLWLWGGSAGSQADLLVQVFSLVPCLVWSSISVPGVRDPDIGNTCRNMLYEAVLNNLKDSRFLWGFLSLDVEDGPEESRNKTSNP